MPYRCLKSLESKGINFKFIPFAQSAMAEIFDKNWSGSCDVLANEWMYRKTCAPNIQDVVTYEITEPLLPHIVVTGDHSPEGPDIVKIRTLMDYAYGEKMSGFSQKQIDMNFGGGKKISEMTKNESTENLLKLIGSMPYGCGIIASLLTISSSKGNKESGHALAFVKRGDAISFFDPNNGELTFDKFSDFCIWFREETTIGALKYILNDPQVDPKKRESLADLHSQSGEVEFSKSSLKVNSGQKLEIDPTEKNLKKRMIKIREKRVAGKNKIKNYNIDPYRVMYWGGNQCINPEKYEQYYGVNCVLALMDKVPQQNDSFLKKLLVEIGDEAYIIVNKECFFVEKNNVNSIEITKLKIDNPPGFDKFISVLNPYHVKLKDTEKFKLVSASPLPENFLIFIDECTHHRYMNPLTNDDENKEVVFRKKGKEEDDEVEDNYRNIGLFAQSENSSLRLENRDKFFEKAHLFLENVNKLSKTSNNNGIDTIYAKIEEILREAQNRYELNQESIESIKSQCNKNILLLLSSIEDKLILKIYMKEVEPFSRQSSGIVLQKR